MNSGTPAFSVFVITLSFYTLATFQTFAADPPPDAGKVMDSTRAPAPVQPPAQPPIDVQNGERLPMPAPAGIKIKVAGFRFTGATVFSETQFLALAKDSVGRELAMAELESVAARITKYYRDRGYLAARAYLPAQEIKDGIVEIAVIEGRYGKLAVTNQSRLADSRITGALRNIQSGDAIQEQPLEESILTLTDLPGAEVKTTLVPGATAGTSDLLVDITPGRLITGSLDLDNYGSRYTGSVRGGATVNINNPSGYGDSLTLRGITGGSGMTYGRVAYQIPVTDRGTRVGVAYSDMHYELGKTFNSLQANGTARIASAYVLHPVVRSRKLNAYVQIGYDDKRLEDRVDATDTVTDKQVGVWTFAVSGDGRDRFGGGGINGFSVTYTIGNLSIDSDDAKDLDDATAGTDGGYGKLNASYLRLQYLNENTTLYLSISGQIAGNNLDSSEKMYLGGAYGVRAYPQGEAAGDHGYLLTAEIRRNLPKLFSRQPGNIQATGFIDTGGVTANKDRWAAADAKNHRTLSAAGLGLTWGEPNNYQVRMSYAWKVGHEDATSDHDRNGRFWFGIVKYF